MNTIPTNDAAEGNAYNTSDTTAPEPPAFPMGRPETRDPKVLDEHPLLRRLFPNGLGDEDQQAEMASSVEKLQRSPILITGTGCHGTPPNVVLDGRRVRRAAIKAELASVQVVVFDDLTEDQQAEVIVHANLAAGMARRLDERQKAELEHFLLERIGKRQGQRTSLAGEGSPPGKGAEWTDLVAADLKEMDPSSDATPNAIRERHLIFYSPVSPKLLKNKVNDGTITRKEAVARVREALKEPDVAAALKVAREKELPPDQVAQLPAIVAANSAIFNKVEFGNKVKRQPMPKATKEKKAEAIILDGTCEIDNFLGRRVQVEIKGDRLVLLDKGESDSDASQYRPDKPVTKSCWAIDVAAAVDCLPGELRSQVTVSEVERLDPVKCPSCGGTVWRWEGGCAKCEPADGGFAPTMNLRLPRHRIRLTTSRGDLEIVLWENIEHRMAWVPAAKAKAGIVIGHEVGHITLESNHFDDSRRALRDKVRAALVKLLEPAPATPPFADESCGSNTDSAPPEVQSDAPAEEAHNLVTPPVEAPEQAASTGVDTDSVENIALAYPEDACHSVPVSEDGTPATTAHYHCAPESQEAEPEAPAELAHTTTQAVAPSGEEVNEAPIVVMARTLTRNEAGAMADAAQSGSPLKTAVRRSKRSPTTEFRELRRLDGRTACVVAHPSRGYHGGWRTARIYESDGSLASDVLPGSLWSAARLWHTEELGLTFERYFGSPRVDVKAKSKRALVVIEGPFPRKSLPYGMTSDSRDGQLKTDWVRIGKSPLAEVYTISGARAGEAILIAHRRTGGREGWDRVAIVNDR